MLTRDEKLAFLRTIAENNTYSPEDVVQLLELSIEELLDAFPDKLFEYEYKLRKLDVDEEDEEDQTREQRLLDEGFQEEEADDEQGPV